jgi:hypothetical protein
MAVSTSCSGSPFLHHLDCARAARDPPRIAKDRRCRTAATQPGCWSDALLTPNARTPDGFLLGRLELRLMGVTLRSTTNSELLAVLGAIIAQRSLRARSTLLPGLVASPTNWSCGSCKVPASIIARSSFAASRERGLGPGEAALSGCLPNGPLSKRARVGRRQRVVWRIDAPNAQIRRQCQVVRLAVELSAVLRMCE